MRLPSCFGAQALLVSSFWFQFHQETGHHVTKILINVKSLALTRKRIYFSDISNRCYSPNLDASSGFGLMDPAMLK
jgi:hypothetical protein